jgi:hypothetical protein
MDLYYTTNIHSNLNGRKKCNLTEYEEICKNNNCHECISDLYPIKLYYDFDYDITKCKNNNEEFRDTTIELVAIGKKLLTNVLLEFYPDKIAPIFVVKCASSPKIMGTNKWKISFHIIITNYCMMKCDQNFFTKKVNLRLMCEKEKYKIQDIINYNEKFKFFDESLYHHYSKLRSVHCSKDNENRPSILTEGTFYDSVVNYIDENCQMCHFSPRQL